MRRFVTSAMFTLVVSVFVGLLPGPAAVTANAAPAALELCTINASNELVCPPVYSQPDLLNPAELEAATPEQADALQAFEQQALGNVLANHELPAVDLPLVKSYARADAQAEIWALMVKALKTPEADRNGHQRAIVDWFGDKLTRLRTGKPYLAAREYAKFAGKNLLKFDDLISGGASEAELKSFLSGPAEPYNTTDTANATGGYCVYQPPAPYQGDYDGSTLQTCFTPCQNPVGCAPPTPTYDEFVKWGSAAAGAGTVPSASFQAQAALISGATMFGATAAIAGSIAVGSTLASVLTGTTIAAIVFPFAGAAVEMAAGAGSTLISILTSVNAAALGSVVGIVLAAIAILTVVGINVANIDQLPGKLAAAATQAQQEVDAAAQFDTADGAATMFSLFVGATLPVPREDMTCDNESVSRIYRSMVNGIPIVEPLLITEQTFSSLYPCLNPAPVPPAQATDPHFVVTNDATGSVTESPAITFEQASTSRTMSARVSGNWFVLNEGAPSGGDMASLRFQYADWDGRDNLAWLKRTATGYQFFGIRTASDGSISGTGDDCDSCWTSDQIRYVGPDGQRRTAKLTLEPLVPPPAIPGATGAPTYSHETAFTASPVTFEANDFQPTGAVGPVTYQWRFQEDGCGSPCMSTETVGGVFQPSFTEAVSGSTASHTWHTTDAYLVELTATDSQGRQAVHSFRVAIANVPAQLTLAPRCTTQIQVGCNSYPTEAGQQISLHGEVELAGIYDNFRVEVDWGDGSSSYNLGGFNNFSAAGTSLDVKAQAGNHSYLLLGKHTYAKPGFYTVRVAVVDRGGATDQRTLVHTIRGPQEVTFGPLPDRRYGQAFTAQATGTDSGFPVTFTAGPAEVCTATDGRGARITPVGIGTCWVTARQDGGGPVYGDAVPVRQSFEVTPAPVEIEPEPKVKVYGAPNPEFTVHVGPLVNGDTVEDFPGLVVAGPAADSDVGLYDIVASGAVNPNYEIRYDTGTLEVRRAELRVTAQDRARVYGDPLPAYTAAFEGLVNGDTAADITGLLFSGPAKEAGVGAHPVRVEGGTNPNYLYTYRDGTETITPAPLRVTANDVTRRYGRTVPYTARYQGLVNGEAGLPGLRFAGADPEAGVGQYPIVVTGTPETHYYDNYDITWIDGTETVTPAPLSIRADNQTRLYGAPAPAYTTALTGLTNGDTRADITGLSVTGAPGGAGVGSYPIEAKGAVNPNYDITYLNGTETVNRAPLAITAHDKSQVYGAPDPTFTASYDGLVNGDTESAVTGLQFAAAPTGSDVGSYPIVPSGATSPNYAISYTHGTQTITPAPLTIRATDKAARYGTVATYTWTGHGWVNGDSDDTIETAPTCTATVQGAAASVTTNPGAYPGAIGCADAADPNYTIGYASGDLTVNPVVRLTQSGLPTTVPHRAYIDGQPIALPTGEVEFGYDTTHTYAFPAVVTDPDGVPHMTTTPGFNGPVTANATITATYTTMTALLTTAVANGGTDQKTATTLTTLWNQVQAGLKTGNTNRTSGALKQFADQIRSQTGKKITKPTATTLLTYTQLVHTSNGGKGTI